MNLLLQQCGRFPGGAETAVRKENASRQKAGVTADIGASAVACVPMSSKTTLETYGCERPLDAGLRKLAAAPELKHWSVDSNPARPEQTPEGNHMPVFRETQITTGLVVIFVNGRMPGFLRKDPLRL